MSPSLRAGKGCETLLALQSKQYIFIGLVARLSPAESDTLEGRKEQALCNHADTLLAFNVLTGAVHPNICQWHLDLPEGFLLSHNTRNFRQTFREQIAITKKESRPN